MVLEWTPEEASLLQDRPFSAAASVYISILYPNKQTNRIYKGHEDYWRPLNSKCVKMDF